MSEKELLYVKDMLGHLEYMHNHLLISLDCISEKEYTKIVQKIIKKVEEMYSLFYSLLGGN